MAVRQTGNACGDTFTAECDECGDEIYEGDSFAETIEGIKAEGGAVRINGHFSGRRKAPFNHYCADCASEQDD